MYRPLLLLLLVISIIHGHESQQLQMQDVDALSPLKNPPVDLAAQLAELQRNVSTLWTYIYELRGAVTHHLNHLREHQVEMENTVHRLEHLGNGHSDSHSAAHTAGHSHSGEDHSHGSNQHSHSDEHHHHSGEHHSHSGEHHSHSGEHQSHSGDDHSHGGDGHSHGSDGHSHGTDGHSHGGDGHSHGSNDHSHSGEHQTHGHYHDSHSHSHTDSGHASGHDNSDGHAHKDSHENTDDLQQTVQVAEPLVEPVIRPSTRQPHNHHHHHHSHGSHSHTSSSTPSSSGFEPLNVIRVDDHHHGHYADGRSSSAIRNRTRTVVMPKYSEYDLYEFAVCNIQANRAIPVEQQQNIAGQISLWQKKSGGSLNIHVRLSGFAMGDHHDHHQHQQQQEEDDITTQAPIVHKHGFHIHTYGDLSNGCQSTGPHYNPKGVNHGAPNALVRHVGDLGNIECDEHGRSNLAFSDSVASLKGPYSVIGKSMVIHTGQDDVGLGNNEESLKTGNAGVRIACCLIEKVEKLPIRSYRAMKDAVQYQNW